MDSLSITFLSTAAAKSYSALAALLRIIETLARWRTAVLDAEAEADRFLRSAKERFDLWLREYRGTAATQPLCDAAASVSTLSRIAEVAEVAASIARVPLPVGVFGRSALPEWAGELIPRRGPELPVELTVAFLKFHIDGVPAADVHYLAPAQVHDLEIEVRVSRWPEDKRELQLTPVSVEPKATYDFPPFSFTRPAGDAPHVLRQTGRAVLLMPQGINARPFEFKYTAEFLPERGDQPVAIVGHRTLVVDTVDPAKAPLCGFPSLDRRLVLLRDALRRRPGVSQEETSDAVRILLPLCNLAGRAVQDAEFRGESTERAFQDHVRVELRRNPFIGVELDEHAHAAGGITDLSLHGLPIELKVSNTLVRSVDDCTQFMAQAASYAVAKSKRTAVLCVLDTSAKPAAAVPAETLLDIRMSVDGYVAVCILIIQGNLAKPSALSR